MSDPNVAAPRTSIPLPTPLQGIRVVEFGQWVAGAAAAKFLADNGAEVVHVHPPGGSDWSVETDENLNRTKRRVLLDLEEANDLEEALRLVRTADVVIENYSPGTMARFGIDYESVSGVNPTVVYLSLPGFASTDQENSDIGAYEGVISTASGQFASMGLNRTLMGVEASYSPLPLASSYAAMFGALAVTLALRARLLHGEGDYIEVPIASSLMEGMAYNSLDVVDLPPRYLSRREQELERRITEGIPLDVTYPEIIEMLDPFYRPYWCADGLAFYIVAVGHSRHPRLVLEALGIFDQAVAAGVPMFDPYMSSKHWPDDSTIYNYPITSTWAKWISSRIAATMATKPSAGWELIFAEHNIPATTFRTTQEWLSIPHVVESGLMQEYNDEVTGPTKRPGPVAWLETVNRPLSSLTSSQEPPPSPSRRSRTSGWLEGITVVDLTNVIAGPTIAGTLARFGARVIKVDPPQPSLDPWNTVLCGLQANRGKESVLLDARSSGGSAALRELIRRADVVTMNATPRQVSALGLSPENLAEFAPRTILCELDAWSGPKGGPWRNRLGYDDTFQAAAGIAARFGGDVRAPEEHAQVGTIDVLGGLAGAFAAALALYAREATGTVHTARTSLAAAGQLLQTPFLYDYEGRGPWDEPSGREARGERPTYQFYRAADNWMFVVVPDHVISSALNEQLGRNVDGLTDDELQKVLSEVFADRPAADWRKALAPLGVAVQPLVSLTALRDSYADTTSAPWSASSFHFNRVDKHLSGYSVTLTSPAAIRPRHAAIVVPRDAPRYGSQTRAILQELGYTPAQMDALVASGDASESWSEHYLPD